MAGPTPSLTGWHRLVTGTRTPTIDAGLAATVHDPMWLLARQYQMGEFVGEDAGTPITARVEANVGPITRYHARGALPVSTVVTGKEVNFRQLLEPLVEGEPVHRRTTPTPRVGTDTGLRLRRMLRAAGLDRYADPITAAFPFPPDDDPPVADPAGLRYLRLMRGRVPDGRIVHAHVAPQLVAPPQEWTWPEGLAVDAADVDALSQCLTNWAGWYGTHYTEPEPGRNAWDPSRQEYRFAVATHDHDAESVFVADGYHGGRLDWDALDAARDVSLGAQSADVHQSTATTRISETALPAPLTFPGMPAARWWELEDAAVDWGGVDAGPTDLVRMLLIDYTLTYANNWFLVPVDIEPGTFTRITSLVVTDVFGVETAVPSAVTDDWRMYTPTGRDDGLLLLPPVYEMMESAPIEDVRILRDESANLAWGIEHLVEGAAGGPVDRHQAARAAATEPAQPSATESDALRYRLATTVPPNWIPFLPVRADDGTLMLARGRMSTDPDAEPPRPLGSVLESDSPALRLFDEEVPRSGSRVTRTYQYAIGPRGNNLWLGRRRATADHGDARSGLRFDTAEPGRTSDAARRS